jgi:hypothetical protein
MATIKEIADWLVNDPDAGKHFERVRSYQTPQVQAQMDWILKSYDYVATGGGREMPFQERLTKKEVCDEYGLDEGHAEKVFQKLVDARLTVELQNRMGTDADLSVPEPTLRDAVAAAVDIHSQGDES